MTLPSSIPFRDGMPLTDTFRRSEAECMAALMVRCMAVRGDAWRPVTLREVFETFTNDTMAQVQPWCRLSTNPYFKPDPIELCKRHLDVRGSSFSYATLSGDTGLDRSIEFTVHGYVALSRWT